MASMMGIILALVSGLAAAMYGLHKARVERQRSRESLYAADINLAQHALGADNFRQALSLLRTHIPRPGETDLRGFEWRYLWRQCQSDELCSVPAHNWTAETRLFTDGRSLATGAGIPIKVWDVESRRPTATFTNDKGLVTFMSVAFSPRGDMLASASFREVRLWDPKTLKPLGSLPGAILKVKFCPDGRWLLTGSTNGVILWDTRAWTVARAVEVRASGGWNSIM